MAKELNKLILGSIAIIGLAVVIIVGIAVSTNYSKVLRTTTVTNVSADAGLLILLTNTSVAVGSSGTYPFLQELTGCVNGSGNAILLTTHYTISEGDTVGGAVDLTAAGITAGWNNTAVNCSVEYLAGSSGQAAADTFTTGLATFGTFAVIVILAMIGKVIIGLFKRKV